MNHKTALEAAKSADAVPSVWPLSVNAYHALSDLGLIPEKTGLLYGQDFHKMSKFPLHRFLAQRLLRQLQRCQPPGCFIWQEQPITCEDSEPEPDLAVIRGCEEDYLREHPRSAELAIEVCEISHEYDRAKLRAYAQAEVKECWLVLGPEKRIEVHRQPSGELFAEVTGHGPGPTISSAALPGSTVDLTRLFEAQTT